MRDEPIGEEQLRSDAALGRGPNVAGETAGAEALTSDVTLGRPRETWEGGRLRLKIPETAALLAVFAVLMIFFSVKSDVFLTQDNLVNVLISVATVGILACPATMLLVAGQFDLSVGSGIALTSSLFAYLATHGWATGAAALAALGVGLAAGMLNGFLVTVIGINALITTLGTLAIYSGLAFIITNGLPIQLSGFTILAVDRPALNMPWSVYIFFAVILISIFVMRTTVFGRTLYAIGANPLAARLAGIRVGRTIFFTFILSGLAVGITGLIAASETGQGSGTAGQGLELSVVTAVILGGASLAGGRGAIFGSVLGVLIIGVIDNGLTLLNVQSFWQDVVRGTLLIAAVGFDVLRARLTKE